MQLKKYIRNSIAYGGFGEIFYKWLKDSSIKGLRVVF